MRDALFRTLPGRAIVVGVAVKLIVALLRAAAGELPPLFGVADTVASLAVAVGAVYFLVRGIRTARRRLLLRIRRKLIISYIFIGFIPATLIVAFFLLGGLLLFSYFSSYLVQSELAALTERAAAIARTTAVEIQRSGSRDLALIIGHRQEALSLEIPGASIAAVQIGRPCAAAGTPGGPPEPARAITVAGGWAHVPPPNGIPTWIGCDGFHGLLAYEPVAAADPS
jgi:hypothetical protein